MAASGIALVWHVAAAVDSARFTAWSAEKGISHPALKVDVVDGLRGLWTTDVVQRGNAAISVPARLAIQVTSAMAAPAGVPKDLWVRSKWYTQLALCLLQSPPSPWLEALPDDYAHLPFHWADADLVDLRYPAMCNSVRRHREEWTAIADEVAAAGLPFTADRVIWALHTVRARAFSGEFEGSSRSEVLGLAGLTAALTALYPALGLGSIDQALTGAGAVAIFLAARAVGSAKILGARRYVVCPFIDMANHNGLARSKVSFDVPSNSFIAVAGTDVAAAEEFVISYGPRSNDQLLLYHGFVESGCPHDVYTMASFLDHVDSEFGLPDAALEALAAQQLLEPIRRGAVLDIGGMPDPPTTRAVDVLAAETGTSPAALLAAACAREQAAVRAAGTADATDDADGGRTDREKTKSAFRRAKGAILEQATQRWVVGK